MLALDQHLVHGSEAPVVLVHAGVADRRMWDPVWAPLTAAVDVVRVDLRGFGDSDERPSGPVSHASDLLEVLDAFGITRGHVVGASLGAGVAVEAALAQPDVVESLVLCPPGGRLLTDRTDDLAAFAEAEDAALTAGDLDGAVRANVDAWVAGVGRSPRDVDRLVVDAVSRMQRRAFEIQLGWGPEVLEDEPEVDPTDRLGEVDLPVLLLVGGLDLLTVRRAADRLTAGLPDVVRVDWPDVAHLPSLEQPQRFADLLLEWLIP
jgi:pimeloyl-ACP methyl ester carboxylesterase